MRAQRTMKWIFFVVIACVASILAQDVVESPPEDTEDLERDESHGLRGGFQKPYHTWGVNHRENEKYFDYLFGKSLKAAITSPVFTTRQGPNKIPSGGKQSATLTGASAASDAPERTTKSYNPRAGEDNNYGYRPDSEYPPDNWQEKWPECGGGRQSPVNLALPSCEKDYGPPFQSIFFKKHPQTTIIRNLGHTVQYSFSYAGTPPILTGAFLDTEYLFAQLHFHFGSNDYTGSEHSINSVTYPMEMHLVFYNSIYNDTQEASNHPDGLLVLGFVYQVLESTPNQRFALYVSDVPTDGTEITIENPRGHRLFDFVGSMDFHYATYEGSLTTPPCSEAVTWIVSTRPKQISRHDLEVFRSLQGVEGPMADNNRPLQSLNGRTCVYH